MTNRLETISKLANSYDLFAREYATRNTPEKVILFIAEQLDFFVSQLPTPLSSTKILDLGSGSGEESSYIKVRFGIIPECIDVSPTMLELCKEKELPVRKEDFSSLSDSSGSVAGSFMNFSLLHVSKVEAPTILGEVHRVLSPGGVLQVTLFEGHGEGFEVKTKYAHPRFFAYYQQDELRHLLSEKFEVIREVKLKNKPKNILSITGKTL